MKKKPERFTFLVVRAVALRDSGAAVVTGRAGQVAKARAKQPTLGANACEHGLHVSTRLEESLQL